MASRHALLIVTDTYGDAGLDRLKRRPVTQRGSPSCSGTPTSGGSTRSRFWRTSRSVRDGTESRALCVFNLSRRATPAALELHDYAGLQPVDLLGHDVFPTIGSPPYVVTMSPHGFFIFRLVEPAEPAT